MTNVLIVDRNAVSCGNEHCASPAALLGRERLFRCWTEAADCLSPSKLPHVPDLVLIRVTKDAQAVQVVARCRELWSDTSIVLILCPAPESSFADLQSVVQYADDFLYCSSSERELLLRSVRLSNTARNKIADAGQCSEALSSATPLVGRSPAFLEVLRQAANLARADAAVLISGETGSGKELIARAIHYHGGRRSQPFIPINCGALPDHLFENEVFGHAKGAFTDASSAENGLIAEAEGGTLFLDEIDTLSPAAQVKLLRFLQNGEYRPLGSSRAMIANVRVIAATNSDLRLKVERQQFREDLFYRLNILSVTMPALRERGEDVIGLAEYFVDFYGARHGGKHPPISIAARRKLANYSWPGNVRELEGVIQRAVLLNTSGTLHAADIELPEGRSKDRLKHESLRQAKSFVIGEFERRYVANLLAEHQGNITQAAKAAGKDRRTLQRLVRKYALNRDSFRF